jgi:hypothetical protein
LDSAAQRFYTWSAAFATEGDASLSVTSPTAAASNVFNFKATVTRSKGELHTGKILVQLTIRNTGSEPQSISEVSVSIPTFVGTDPPQPCTNVGLVPGNSEQPCEFKVEVSDAAAARNAVWSITVSASGSDGAPRQSQVSISGVNWVREVGVHDCATVDTTTDGAQGAWKLSDDVPKVEKGPVTVGMDGSGVTYSHTTAWKGSVLNPGCGTTSVSDRVLVLGSL